MKSMKIKQKKDAEAVDYLITQPGRTTPHQDKPVLSIGTGLLVIEDCGCNHVTLDLESAKELLRLLPGLLSILERICDGDGRFKFGNIP